MRNILLFSLIFLCTIVFAQEESKTSIAGGAKALIFEFDGLDNLSANSYEGGIGGKIFFSNSLALRVGFNFDRISEEYPANPSAVQRGVKGEYVETAFGIGAGIEIHTRSKSRVSPYFGGGFEFMHGSSEYKPVTYYPDIDDYPATRIVTERTGIYEFNLLGVIGAELFVLKELSLSAEYVINIGFYGDGDVKRTEVAVSGDPDPTVAESYTEKGDSGWMIGTNARGRLILSIYF
jgi:hypothetical protein